MAVIAWIVLGLIVGAIACWLLSRTGGGMLIELCLGVAGAVFSGCIFIRFGAAGLASVDIYSILVSLVGAVLALFVYHAITATQEV